MKLFDKSRKDGASPIDRIKTEIEILSEGHAGLAVLLASNADDLWPISEFFPKGTLEHNRELFRGDAPKALRAFRTLVQTIARLHKKKIVHRDVKPANVFVSIF